MFIRSYFVRPGSNSVSTERLHYEGTHVPEIMYFTQQNHLFQSDIRASASHTIAESFRKNNNWK